MSTGLRGVLGPYSCRMVLVTGMKEKILFIKDLGSSIETDK
jgi:hypothetical protein